MRRPCRDEDFVSYRMATSDRFCDELACVDACLEFPPGILKKCLGFFDGSLGLNNAEHVNYWSEGDGVKVQVGAHEVVCKGDSCFSVGHLSTEIGSDTHIAVCVGYDLPAYTPAEITTGVMAALEKFVLKNLRRHVDNRFPEIYMSCECGKKDRKKTRVHFLARDSVTNNIVGIRLRLNQALECSLRMVQWNKDACFA